MGDAGPNGTDPGAEARALEARIHELERRVFEAEAKYASLVEQLPAAIYVDAPEADGATYYVSPQIRDLLGVTPADYIGRDAWVERIHPDDRERMLREYASFLETGEPEAGDYRYLRPGGEVVWIHDRAKIVRDPDGRPLFVQGVMFDVTAQKEAELRVQHMAYHDTLTDLPNRAMFEEHLTLAIARARRAGAAVAVLFMDLDGFKDVNDAMGHSAGDELLRVVAGRLRQATRATDLVARLGGDEFLVLLADLADERGPTPPEIVQVVARRIADAVAAPIPLRDRVVATTISIGVAMYPAEAGDAEALMGVADAAMYAHKRRGKGARLVG
ncbi:MAG TPA: sensor domain-containing diguanylate cyclase [Actinomycetota bacterium]